MMSRGRPKQKENNYCFTSRPLRYENGYGTVYMIDRTGRRRKPFVVKVPLVTTRPQKEGEKVKYKYRTIGYAASWDEGNDMLRQFHIEHDLNNTIEINSVTFKEVYDLALPRKLIGASEATSASYEYGMGLCTSLYEMPVVDIKTVHMQRIIDTLRDEGKSTSTFRSVRKVCNLVFDYALKNDLTDKDYASYLDLGRSTEQAKKLPFTHEEIRRLFDNDSIEFVDTILIMLYTDVRLNEFLSIKTEDIHIKERYLITGSKTEAGKNRVIPISHKIEKYIIKMYNANHKYLFCPFEKNAAVNKSTYRSAMFDVVMKRLKMQHTPHECRHTFVSMLDNAGANKVAIQKIVGHKGTDITEQIYTHKGLEQLLEAIDLL